MEYLYVKNYHKYQHYSDRHILWIKLYISTLSDYKFMQLSSFEKWFFIGLILLASKNKNKIHLDTNYIRHQLTLSEDEEKGLNDAIKHLSDLELIASRLIASCLPRREEKRREENRKEKKKKERLPSLEEVIHYGKQNGFGDRDLKLEYTKMVNWCDSNKYPTNWKNFVLNWLKKAPKDVEAIKRRETEAELKKTEELKAKGIPMPEKYQRLKANLIKKVSV